MLQKNQVKVGRVNNPSPNLMTNFLKQLNILTWHLLAIISMICIVLNWADIIHPSELASAVNLLVLLISSAVIDIRKDISAK